MSVSAALAIGLGLGFVIGILVVVARYRPMKHHYSELVWYKFTNRVLVQERLPGGANTFKYRFSFNSGLWCYELYLSLDGQVLECARVEDEILQHPLWDKIQ